MNILVITGGNVQMDFASDFLDRKKFDKVICADHGLVRIDSLRVSKPELAPSVIMGDFDSVSPELVSYYAEKPGVEVVKFNPEKDYTDTRLALEKALSFVTSDEDSICILGGSGTRLDHTLANIHLLEIAMDKCANVFLQDAYNKVYLLKGEKEFLKKTMFGDFLSLLPLKDSMTLSIKGFKYELDNVTIEKYDGRCVSNELHEERGFINISSGIAIVFETRDVY